MLLGCPRAEAEVAPVLWGHRLQGDEMPEPLGQGCVPRCRILPRTGLAARTGTGPSSLAGTGCGGELFGEVWTKGVRGGRGLSGWLRRAGRGVKQCPPRGLGGVSPTARRLGSGAAVSAHSGVGCPCRPPSHPGERQERWRRH